MYVCMYVCMCMCVCVYVCMCEKTEKKSPHTFTNLSKYLFKIPFSNAYSKMEKLNTRTESSTNEALNNVVEEKLPPSYSQFPSSNIGGNLTKAGALAPQEFEAKKVHIYSSKFVLRF